MSRTGTASCALLYASNTRGASDTALTTKGGREGFSRDIRDRRKVSGLARVRKPKTADVERREASVPRGQVRWLRKLVGAGCRAPGVKRGCACLDAPCVCGPAPRVRQRVPRKHPSACRRSAPSRCARGIWQASEVLVTRENDDACSNYDCELQVIELRT